MRLGKQLIAIARDDIKSARILYERGQYRTSFFLFQQASEKAGKALGIILGKISTENEMIKYGHAIELMFLTILQEIANNTEIIKKAIKEKKLQTSDELAQILNNFNEDFGSSLSSDVIKKGQIENSTLSEIDAALEVINSLKNGSINYFGFGSHANFMLFLKEHFLLSGVDDVETLNQVFDSDEFNYCMKYELLPIITELGAVVLSVLICALVVKGHASLVRYPYKGKNPLSFYTKRNPSVKRQPELLKLLSKSLKSMEKFNSSTNDSNTSNISLV